MKYYRFINTCIRCHDEITTEGVVSAMRSRVNANLFHSINIMIEDIQPTDEEDYLGYVLDKANRMIELETGFTNYSQLDNYLKELETPKN